MFSLMCARINGWKNGRDAIDLGRHDAHNVVTVKETTNYMHPLRTDYKTMWIFYENATLYSSWMTISELLFSSFDDWYQRKRVLHTCYLIKLVIIDLSLWKVTDSAGLRNGSQYRPIRTFVQWSVTKHKRHRELITCQTALCWIYLVLSVSNTRLWKYNRPLIFFIRYLWLWQTRAESFLWYIGISNPNKKISQII